MSKLCKAFCDLSPYTPGEQPRDFKYVKLNTNESPYAPSKNVSEAVKNAANRLNLYSDPESKILREKMSEVFCVSPDEILMTNGSDEALMLCFLAFCQNESVAYPEISYGFYSVYAKLCNAVAHEIPLTKDFEVKKEDYFDRHEPIFIANPNAPTSLALTKNDIEDILIHNRDTVVIIDEAYVDFGAESAVSLIKKYDNLVCTGTFSKSRSLAGARVGFAFACPELINDLNTIKFSTNPYNVGILPEAAAMAALNSNDYYMNNCKKIIDTREMTTKELRALGFFVLDSKSNFVFCRHEKIGGNELYLTLKKMGILVRHFSKPLISDFLRITIGTPEQMDILLSALSKIINK